MASRIYLEITRTNEGRYYFEFGNLNTTKHFCDYREVIKYINKIKPDNLKKINNPDFRGFENRQEIRKSILDAIVARKRI